MPHLLHGFLVFCVFRYSVEQLEREFISNAETGRLIVGKKYAGVEYKSADAIAYFYV